jgi:hypothetical protein
MRQYLGGVREGLKNVRLGVSVADVAFHNGREGRHRHVAPHRVGVPQHPQEQGPVPGRHTLHKPL